MFDSSEIYCYGDLLKTVQLKNIYPDSKTFVDLKQKDAPSVTLQKFQALMDETGGDPDREKVNNHEGLGIKTWQLFFWQEW